MRLIFFLVMHLSTAVLNIFLMVNIWSYCTSFNSRRQWVREEDLAKDLKIHLKQLRRTLRFFEEEKLVMRDHRKEVCFAST